MDSTTRCAFGLDVDSQGDPEHPFVAHAKKTFQVGFVFNPLIVLVGKCERKLKKRYRRLFDINKTYMDSS